MRAVAVLTLLAGLAGCNDLILGGEPPGAASNVHPEVGTPIVTDVISQTVQPRVDILWVVDNSCSMAEEQALLADNFPRFMEYFLSSGLDYHIGITTTDVVADYAGTKGKLVPKGGFSFITPQTASVANPVDIFSQMVKLGTSGDASHESEAQPTYMAINRSIEMTASQNTADPNYDFYREDAALHVIVITDEKEQSFDGTANKPQYAGEPRVASMNEFVDWMNGLKSDPKIPVSYSAIAGPPPMDASSPDPRRRNKACPILDADAAPMILSMVSAIGTLGPDGFTPGQFFPICEKDWTPILDQLGFLTSSLHTSYYLTELPVVDSIEVTVVPPKSAQGTPVYEGINDRSLPENYTSQHLDRACKKAGAAACFSFHYNVVGNSVDMVAESDPNLGVTGTETLNARGLKPFVPAPKATVSVTYQLLGAFEDVGDSDGFFGDSGADSGDPQ